MLSTLACHMSLSISHWNPCSHHKEHCFTYMGQITKTMCTHIDKLLLCVPEHQLLEQQHCTVYPQKAANNHAFLYSAPNKKDKFSKSEVYVLIQYHDAIMNYNTSEWFTSNPYPRGIDIIPCPKIISKLYQVPHLHMFLTQYRKKKTGTTCFEVWYTKSYSRGQS